MAESKFNIQAKIAKLNTAKVELPKLLANVGQTYFSRNYQKQQWDGKAWDVRKEGTWYAKKMAGKAILTGSTGDLKRAVQNSIISFDWNKIVWGVKDVQSPTGFNYAEAINFGTPNMVKRQFMGIDEGLMKAVKKKIESEFEKVMKHTNE